MTFFFNTHHGHFKSSEVIVERWNLLAVKDMNMSGLWGFFFCILLVFFFFSFYHCCHYPGQGGWNILWSWRSPVIFFLKFSLMVPQSAIPIYRASDWWAGLLGWRGTVYYTSIYLQLLSKKWVIWFLGNPRPGQSHHTPASRIGYIR
jgi:hypothetical protein